MITSIFASFSAVLGYAIIADAPKRELGYISLAGIFSWLPYLILTNNNMSPLIATVFGGLSLAYYCRIMSFNRKNPITLYLIPGFLPLAPGSTLYKATINYIDGKHSIAIGYSVLAVELTIAIAIGIAIIMSLPSKYAHIKIKPIYKKR